MQLRPSYECRRPIKMSPLCQLQITLAVAIRKVQAVRAEAVRGPVETHDGSG